MKEKVSHREGRVRLLAIRLAEHEVENQAYTPREHEQSAMDSLRERGLVQGDKLTRAGHEAALKWDEGFWAHEWEVSYDAKEGSK